MGRFRLISNFKPTGDQPQAIEKLADGLKCNYKFQVLLGVTGSGKTFTMASVIEKVQRPALVIAPNKILAAQLFQEFRTFFPKNNIGFFVSYYDYYQPEAYLPETDTYIAKDAKINKLLDLLRHGALQSILTTKDFIVVSSVSCLYGIGDPTQYKKIGLELKVGDRVTLKKLENKLRLLQYEKKTISKLTAGSYSVINNSTIKFILPDGGRLCELLIKGGILKKIVAKNLKINIKNENILEESGDEVEIEEIKIYPAKFFLTEKERLLIALENIESELHQRFYELIKEGRFVEAERLRQRTLLDIQLLKKNNYCPGIENYSRHLSFRKPGEPPYTLLDYLPPETIIFIDESHLTVPQIKAMAEGDRQRKLSLIEYGWRLPSAIDNRPLTFEEFFNKDFQFIFVSATPADFEKKISSQIVEQLIRPTGIPDPEITLRPARNQIEDLLSEIKKHTAKNYRVLVLTVTKREAEYLCDFLLKCGIKAHYLHSEIPTLKRSEIIKKLRQGEIDVLIGINLLREGLDLPEVSLIAILDADKEGFLRNPTTLIQAIGRAARHPEGKAILYAERITDSIKSVLEETERRRRYQLEFNLKYNITPKQIIKELSQTPAEILGHKYEDIERENYEDLIEFLKYEESMI